nr:hypothetical protein [uncultured Roseateles sp.]
MADIGALNVRIGGDTADLDNALTHAQGKVLQFSRGASNAAGGGVAKLKDATKELGDEIGGMVRGPLDNALGAFSGLASRITSALGPMGALVGIVGGAAVGLELMARGAREQAEGIGELAEKLGITTTRLQALQLIAAESGGSAEGLARVYDKVAKQSVELANGSEAATRAFAALGLTMDDIAGKTESQIAGIVIDRFDALGQSLEATAAAQEILGRSFREQLPSIRAATQQLGEYEARVKAFGAEVTTDLVAAGARQEEAASNLGLAWQGLGNEVARNTSEMTTDISNWAAQTLNSIREVMSEFRQERERTSKVAGFREQARAELGPMQEGASPVKYNNALRERTLQLMQEAARQEQENGRAAVRAIDAQIASREALRVETEKQVAAATEVAKREEAAKKAAEAAASALKQRNEMFAQLSTQMQTQAQLSRNASEYERVLWEVQKGRLATLTEGQKEHLLLLAREIDARTNLEAKAAKALEDLKAYDEAEKRADEERLRRKTEIEGKLAGLKRELGVADTPEALQEKYATELELLKMARENELLTEQEWYTLKEQLYAQHAERMVGIRGNQANAITRLAMSQASKENKILVGGLAQLFTAFGTHSKKMFRLQQAAGIAEALINAYKGISLTLATYPYPINIGMAAGHAAAAFAQINAIRSQSFNGGGGSGDGGGAAAVGAAGGGGGAGAAATPAGAGRTVSLSLVGEVFGREQVRNLITRINEEVADGAVIRIA